MVVIPGTHHYEEGETNDKICIRVFSSHAEILGVYINDKLSGR